MTIETLMKVIPPPAAPFEAFSGPWAPIEAGLGTVLPQDYKDFVRLYGQGYFMEFLSVVVPWSRYGTLKGQALEVRYVALEIEEYSHPFWPDPDGLICFGTTDFGDYLLWLPQGSPETWPVVVWGRGMGEFERFDCDLTDFLAGVATGEIVPSDFPSEMLPCDRMFEPTNPRDVAGP